MNITMELILEVQDLKRLTDLLERRIIWNRSNMDFLDPTDEIVIEIKKQIVIDQILFYKLEKIINQE